MNHDYERLQIIIVIKKNLPAREEFISPFAVG